MQSVSITTDVRSNPIQARCTQYNIMCKVCQWFSSGTPVSSINKTDCQVITEILLKVALNTITLTSPHIQDHITAGFSSSPTINVYYSSLPFIRPPLLQWKKSSYKKGGLSWEVKFISKKFHQFGRKSRNLPFAKKTMVFNYLFESEIWPDKISGIWW